MALFAISDLHLSFYKPKPMDIFDKIWENHPQKIKESWEKIVTDKDTVLIPGDISWASKLLGAKLDLDYISSLPGQKYLTYGNHDYWWGSTAKLNELYDNMTFVKKGVIYYEKYAICCIRGWICPNDKFFKPEDEKIYLKEARRLEKILAEISKEKDFEPLVMLHFPPTNDKLENSLFTETIKKYNVKKVIFGHIHGDFDICPKGDFQGVFYNLVSADYLNFKPIKLF